MKHHLYETWILLDADLDHEQQRDLHSHLRQCSQCQVLYQATHQIAHLFKTAPDPAPAPNFSARWMERIEKAEKRKNRLILGITLGVMALATLILLSSVGLQLRTAADTFPQMLLNLVSLLADWIIFINQLSDIFTPLFRVGAKLISPIWSYGLMFGLSGITSAWIISIYRSKSLQKELG